MKLFLSVLFLCTYSLFVTAQIEVTKGKFPFNQIIEWPGKGTLLLGEDPTGKTVEINFNLFNHNGEVSWNRSVYPKSKSTHIIVSEMSDYLYFVDDLKPVNNDIRYNQVNQSGSIVPTKLDMLAIIRSYRYTTPSDLELKNIVNTPKALVFYFQLPVKNKNIIENFFVTITHHNNRVYHYQGPVSNINLIKEGKEGELSFAGADENAICFSRFEHTEKKDHIRFYPFSPKAEPIGRTTLTIPEFSPLSSTIEFAALDGRYYINKENKLTIEAQGKGLYSNGEYFYALNDAKERCLKLYGRNEEGESVLLNECLNSAEETRKYQATLTVLPIKGKMIVISNINNKSSALEINHSQIQPIAVETINMEKIQKNPSSFQVENKSANFVHFINGVPHFFENTELGKSDQIIFKKL